MRPIQLGLSFSILMLCGACSSTTSHALPSPGRDQWIARHGGVAGGHEQAAVDRALSRLGYNVRASVLNSPEPGSFAWPDGRIYVSRGLIELLDGDELMAAVAHELGHLVIAGRLRSPEALAGDRGSTEVESRADDIARSLLRAAGTSDDALARALIKVRDRLPSGDPCHALMDARIRRISL